MSPADLAAMSDADLTALAMAVNQEIYRRLIQKARARASPQ